VSIAAGLADEGRPPAPVAGRIGQPTRIETVVVGCVFIGLNLFSDVLYRVLDPRAR
jgi:hypothetical protein